MDLSKFKEQQKKAFKVFFSSFDILKRAEEDNCFPILLSKDMDALISDNPTGPLYAVLFLRDMTGSLLYDEDYDPKYPRFGTLLRRCLHKHWYNPRTGEAHFEDRSDPNASPKILNIWEHEITTEPDWGIMTPLKPACYRLEKGDDGAAIEKWENIFKVLDGKFVTYGLLYNANVKEYWTFTQRIGQLSYILNVPEGGNILISKWDGVHIAQGFLICEPGNLSIKESETPVFPLIC